MRSLPPPLRSPPGGGQHFKPFNSRSCLVPRPGGRRPSRKKSPTTALNHHTLPSAHTDNIKPSEAKKMHTPPPPLRSPPGGGQHFKPFNLSCSAKRLAIACLFSVTVTRRRGCDVITSRSPYLILIQISSPLPHQLFNK